MNGQSSLAQFLNSQFSAYSTNRQPLDAKWLRNYNAYRGIAEKPTHSWRSDAVVNVTQQKVLTVFSIISDVMFSGGQQLPFMFKLADMPGLEDEQWADAVQAHQDLAEEQLVKGCADREAAKIILSTLKYGEGWYKKVLEPVQKSTYVESEIGGGIDSSSIPVRMRRFERITEDEIIPTFRAIPIRQMYWDMEADSIQEMYGLFQCKQASKEDLRGLLDTPFAVQSAISRILTDSKNTAYSSVSDGTLTPAQAEVGNRKRTHEFREYWGKAPTRLVERYEETENIGLDATDATGFEEDGNETEIFVLMCDGEIVRFARSTAEERPFGRVVCDRDPDEPYGLGLPDKLEGTQARINRTVRLFEDGKAISSQPMLFFKPHALKGGIDELFPGKATPVGEDVDRASDAVFPFIIPDVSDGLINLLSLLFQWSDEESLVPRQNQGMSDGQEATATEVLDRQEKSQKYMSGITRNVDEGLIEGVMQWIYDYNISDPSLDIPRPPLSVQALGFSSFQNRQVRVRRLQQLLGMVMADPELRQKYKIDEIVKEIMRAEDLDEEQFERTPEEMQMLEQQQQQLSEQERAIALESAKADLEKTQAEARKIHSEAQDKEVKAAISMADAKKRMSEPSMSGAQA